MTEESQNEKLRQHFARRVTTQARVVLDTWQKIQDNPDKAATWRDELAIATDKLTRYARRFDMADHANAGERILQALRDWPSHQPLTDTLAEHLEAGFADLRCTTRRQTDPADGAEPQQYRRTPVYIALPNGDLAARLIRQLEFFGFRASAFHTADELIEACALNKPETILVDVNFGGGPNSGISMVERLQARHETPIPIIFVSEDDGSIETRLRASRCGGEEFFYPAVDPGQLIEKIEAYTHGNNIEPYKVLVLDDSKAQAKYMETVLKKAGMVAHIITDPMDIIRALEAFSPEIIILDMYMPGCTGMEIARVIRQQDKFHSVPIIYLSAEEDVTKQLQAMSLGGDDFLTKPIDPKHLIATLHNRGRRARSLLALMIRDSLTGLYNHTHTLHLLEQEIVRAGQKDEPLCFAMLDIDYFKKVNDTYGHPIGDRILRNLSMFLKQRLRKTDHIGRYGGEEFAIILTGTGPEGARQVLDNIRESFSKLQQPAGEREFSVTFSCGVACWQPGESSQALCERADRALYKSKGNGRNQVTIACN
ncbi:diguanylate cyclase (GGDEF) domain-containing protein [Marinobacter persicus]|uniref:diguanylate cyclase n=1 Tax=Marinobacter persicus TaxID=930118 RepID=A0A1I3R0H9_9GAMM|nr:diguanylate cyclase [Marinobacter persicus]GHD43288.1 diguanylate cyclase [Marinobacter persicus]SFJ39209.1 diguanylate cyclase (GGDEF) domain-containing protein [Marinobacter persicus]